MLNEKSLNFVTGKVTVPVLISDNQLVFSFGWYALYFFGYTEIQNTLETRRKEKKKSNRLKNPKNFPANNKVIYFPANKKNYF